MFELHPQLAEDCSVLGDLPLCRVLLLEDANYPWLVLVPRRAGLREAYELAESEQLQLQRESCQVSRLICEHFAADKMNVAALGNMVEQLHLHHIARFRSDAAWPAPVWGAVPRLRYGAEQLSHRIEALKALFLQADIGFTVP